jgi:transposase
MAKPLSRDLRERVVAVIGLGMSHREAGARFNVSAASVSRWRALERIVGDVAPKPVGGDRRSHRIDDCKDVILSLLAKTPDMTIEEMRQALSARGHQFGYGTVQRFFKRHAITRKKRPPMPRSKSVPMS